MKPLTTSQRVNVLLLAGLVILLYILLADKCSNPVPKPIIIKGKDVVKEISLVEKQKKAIEDSFRLILNKAYKSNDENYAAYLKALNENSELYKQNKILSMPVPDTCKPLMMAWIERERQLKKVSDNKDAIANRTITGLQGTVREQGRFLVTKDTMYNRLKKVADTCATALTKLEKYADKIKPKRELNVGIIAISPYTLLKPAAGITLGYRGNNGTEINIGYYTNNMVSIGIKKTLIKF